MIEEHLGSDQTRGPVEQEEFNRRQVVARWVQSAFVLLFSVVAIFVLRIHIRAACSYESYD